LQIWPRLVPSVVQIAGGLVTPSFDPSSLLVLPALSEAVQSTVVVPTGNSEPEAGVQDDDATPEPLSSTLTSLPPTTGLAATVAIFMPGSRTSMPYCAEPFTFAGVSSRLAGATARQDEHAFG
jgi:hypothetical protein